MNRRLFRLSTSVLVYLVKLGWNWVAWIRTIHRRLERVAEAANET